MTSSVKWYFKTADGMVYGPVDLQVLKAWQSDDVFVPGNQVSSDGENWIPADECDFDAMAGGGADHVTIPDIQMPALKLGADSPRGVPVIEIPPASASVDVRVDPIAVAAAGEPILAHTLKMPDAIVPITVTAPEAFVGVPEPDMVAIDAAHAAERTELTTQIESLQTELQSRGAEIESLKAIQVEATVASTKVGSDLEAVRASNASEKNGVEDQLADLRAELKEQSATTEARVAELQSVIDAKDRDLEALAGDLTGRVESTTGQVEDLTEKLASEAQSHVMEQAELQAEVERLTTELEFATSLAINSSEGVPIARVPSPVPVEGVPVDDAFADLHTRLDAMRSRCRTTLDRYSEPAGDA